MRRRSSNTAICSGSGATLRLGATRRACAAPRRQRCRFLPQERGSRRRRAWGQAFPRGRSGAVCGGGKAADPALRETVSLQGLLARGDQLWIATNQGAYVLEKERLVRVTEPFVDVRKIKEAGSDVWLLTKKPGDMFGASGPAYRVADYLAHAYPGGKAQVTDVVELGGRTWLLGAPGPPRARWRARDRGRTDPAGRHRPAARTWSGDRRHSVRQHPLQEPRPDL